MFRRVAYPCKFSFSQIFCQEVITSSFSCVKHMFMTSIHVF